jgi:hypothetical protein
MPDGEIFERKDEAHINKVGYLKTPFFSIPGSARPTEDPGHTVGEV